MNKVRSKTIFLFGLAALILFLTGLTVLFGAVGQKAFAADELDAETDNPTIIATSNIGADKNYGGRLEIDSVPIALNKTASYTSAQYGNSIVLRAVADSYFEIDTTEYVFKVIEGSLSNGVFTSLGNIQTLYSNGATFNIPLGYEGDYLVEVYFTPKVFTINWWTEYYGETIREPSNEIGLKNDGFASVGSNTVWWGAEICFANTIMKDDNGAYLRDVRFCSVQIKNAVGDLYSSMNMDEKTADPNDNADKFTMTFGKAELDKFVSNEEVVIIGVYTRVYSVNLTSATESGETIINNNSALKLIAISPVTTDGANVTLLTGPNTYYIDEGSNVTVQASTNKTFRFVKFVINKVTESSEVQYNINSLESDIEIVTQFKPAEYTLYIRGILTTLEDNGGGETVESYGKYVDLGNNGSIYVNGIKQVSTKNGTVVHAFDELSNAGYVEMDGYKSIGMAIKSGKDCYSFENITIIDSDFIKDLVENQEIIIVVKLLRMYSLEMIIPSASEGLGSYQVMYAADFKTVDLTKDNYFEAGTVLKIIAKPASGYHSFLGFSGVATTDYDPDNAKAAIITMDSSKTINVNFKADAISLKTSEDDDFEFSKTTQIKIGDSLVITYLVSGSEEIKDWKLDGVSIDKFGSDAVINGNVLTLTLSEDVLNALYTANADNVVWEGAGYSLKLVSDITTGMGTGTLMAIVLPATLIPLSIAIFLTFFLINYRRKKLIKSQLTEELKRDATLNAGSFIQGLREGTVSGKVDKEEIKKAMKDKKKK